MAARRKRPRLFSFSRDVEIASFSEVVTDPEERSLLEAIVDVFIEVCRSHALPPDGLVAFAAGAAHPAPSVRGVALTRLAVLSHYFDDAARLLETVAAAEDEELRLFACAVIPNAPDNVAVPLITRALEDPSWRVRKAAAQASATGHRPELIEVLGQRIGMESDARVRVLLQLALDFQRASRAPT
jgi:HEAT repeats